ncbi:unnamed protein product [Umbelopsis vinacea]
MELINDTQNAGVLQAWATPDDTRDLLLTFILTNTIAYFGMNITDPNVSLATINFPCAAQMGPTQFPYGIVSIHVTDGCSELYITPNSSSVVFDMQLTLNEFTATLSITGDYVASGRWGDMIGRQNVNKVMNSWRPIPVIDVTATAVSTDLRFFWSVNYTSDGITIDLMRLYKMIDNYYNIYDWQIKYSAYALKTTLFSPSFLDSSQVPNIIWPSDTPNEVPSYVYLGRAAIRDFFFVDTRCNAISVPNFDYGVPYPLPPSPNVVKFMFNENMTRSATQSYGYAIRKTPGVRYYEWPLMKLISISAGAKTKASYNGKVDEVSYEIVASKDRQQVATILNGHLIAYLPQANDSHSENLMPDEAYYAQQHGKYSASKEHQLEIKEFLYTSVNMLYLHSNQKDDYVAT